MERSIFIGFLILMIVALFFYQRVDYLEGFGASYYKCKKYGNNQITNDVFTRESINRTYDDNWDFYIPCGYNYVETELRGLKVANPRQKIFGIDGCDTIVSKNEIWNSLEKKYGRSIAKTLMPETFIIDKPADIALFKKHYKSTNLYLMKKNIQRKLGIKLTNNINEILNNTDTKFRVIQEYAKDLYLIDNRKINLRIYLLITCRNGKVKAFVHRLGKCIYTNLDYIKNDLNPERHLTSLNITGDIYKTRPQTFNELQTHLGAKKYELLMNNLYSNLILVMKATSHRLCNLSNLKNNVTFQLFGLDYIFTNSMYPYLLEMNKGPDMNPKNNTDIEIKTKVIRDSFLTVGIINKQITPNGFMRLKID